MLLKPYEIHPDHELLAQLKQDPFSNASHYLIAQYQPPMTKVAKSIVIMSYPLYNAITQRGPQTRLINSTARDFDRIDLNKSKASKHTLALDDKELFDTVNEEGNGVELRQFGGQTLGYAMSLEIFNRLLSLARICSEPGFEEELDYEATNGTFISLDALKKRKRSKTNSSAGDNAGTYKAAKV
ncbi:MAG: hypothetical protein SV765_03755 [Pseudomonadota bacterium]|nr:hypothetical protein [Pseudomonadota bacterium]